MMGKMWCKRSAIRLSCTEQIDIDKDSSFLICNDGTNFDERFWHVETIGKNLQGDYRGLFNVGFFSRMITVCSSITYEQY